MNILVVDDDRDLAESLAGMLEVDGHRATLAFTGEDGIARFRRERFDLTLMDVKLPGISGVEALDEIRQMSPGAQIIMMTAYRVGQLLGEAVDNGAVTVLQKPFTVDMVSAALRQAAPEGIVLLIDDDPDFATELRESLGESGIRLSIAATGEEAFDRVSRNGFDALILDLRLPVMSGLEVYLELKRRGRVMPTIIVTGYGQELAQDIEALRSMSVMGCLFKPFKMTELLRMVRNIWRDKQRPVPSAEGV